MTRILDRFCPAWLKAAAIAPPDPLAGSELDFTAYLSDWDAGRLVVTARHRDMQWTATVGLPDLESALEAAFEGLDSDVVVAGETVPVRMEDDEVRIPFGPFLVAGTVDAWRKTIDRERVDALPLSQIPATKPKPWQGDRLQFPVTSIE